MGWNPIETVTNTARSIFAPGSGGGSSIPGLGDLSSIGGGSWMDMVPGLGDARAAERANAQNIKLAIANRDWMERMSNSAYQRAMADMKKAGLNPMLAYQQGGASVPTSTAPTVEAASKTRLADAAIGAYTGISTAQTQRQQANTAQASAQSSIALQASQAAQAVANTEKTQAETVKTIDSLKNQKAARQLLQNQAKLETVKTSAADIANKGLSTVERVADKVLKNTAKPSVNEKTLQYENPLIPKFIQPLIKKGK